MFPLEVDVAEQRQNQEEEVRDPGRHAIGDIEDEAEDQDYNQERHLREEQGRRKLAPVSQKETHEGDDDDGDIDGDQRPGLLQRKDNAPAERHGRHGQRGYAVGKPESLRMVFGLSQLPLPLLHAACRSPAAPDNLYVVFLQKLQKRSRKSHQ